MLLRKGTSRVAFEDVLSYLISAFGNSYVLFMRVKQEYAGKTSTRIRLWNDGWAMPFFAE